MNERVPEGWITRKLGEFCFHKTLRAQDKNLRPFSISKMLGIVPQEEKFKKRVASTDISNYKIIEPKDFAYDPMLLWDGSINRNNRIETGAVSPAYVVFQISSVIIDSDYFLHFLKSSLTINFYKNISKGTNKRRQKAEFSDFSSGTFSFPPLPEQKKIASILTSVDEVIENTQKQIDKLQDLKKATMNELLTKGVGHTKFKDSELGKIPIEWKLKTLGNVSLIVMGQSPDSKTYNDKGNGLPFFQGKADFGVRTPKVKYWCSVPSKVAPKNSILFSVRAPVGDINFSTEKCCIGRGLASIKATEVEQEFLYQSLLYSKRKFEALGQGSTFEAINGAELKGFTIRIPPVAEQKKIASILTSIDETIEDRQRKLRKTKSLKKSLMQDLLTGKVRVKVN